MNIMLTDIRSLTLDMPELPVVEQGGEDSFTRLLHQQFPQEVENVDQVVEFKEFLLKVSGSSSDPETLSVKAPDSSWRDYLAQQQIQVTTDADPVAMIPVELNQVPTKPPLAPVVVSDITPAVTGDALPAGGNLLPDSSVISAEILPAKAGLPLTPVNLAVVATSPGTVGLESVQNPVPPSLTSNAAEAGKIGVVTTAIPDHKDVDAARLPVMEPLPARLAGVQSRPEGGAETSSIENPEIVRRNESIMRGGQAASVSPGAMTRVDKAAEGLQNPAAAGIERLDGRVAVTHLSQDLGAREALLAREPLPVAVGPNREQPVLDEIASARAVSVAADKAVAGDPRDALGNLATMTRAPAEAAAPEVAGNRGFELPVPSNGNPAPQNISSIPATAHIAAAVTTSAPLIVQQPLPAQFETMNLARSTDATEWGNGLGERVSWMINQKQNTATIRIDPPMLGKLDVQVRIADDATTITIQTQHAQTRDLIESASQRLRDFLQENGYQNVNVDVSQRQDQQQARSQTASDEQAEQAEESSPQQEPELQAHEQSQYFIGEGVLDTFA